MNRLWTLNRIVETGVIGIVRLDSASLLMDVADSIREGGADVIEFTMTTPSALETIAEASTEFGDEVLLGAGTVLDAETARAVILAGARFVVSPTLSALTIEVCHRYGAVAIPGALTPTEILTAWECGADLVKVFPARLGGPRYVRDVLAPLPQVRLVPTGGVGVDNATEFIRAGAAAVAVGSSLVDRRAVAQRAFDVLTTNARRLTTAVRDGRTS